MTEPAPIISKRKVISDLYYGFKPNKPTFTPDDYPDLTGKLAIVTGSNTGIGCEVVKVLYNKNCDVISIVRNSTKGEEARQKTMGEFPESKGSITVVSGCDFLDLSNVKGVGAQLKEVVAGRPLSIVIHNAGLMLSGKQFNKSKQGAETMFQTNVMGPQLLQHFIDPLFLKKDSDLKRIVWVSSAAHLLSPSDYGIYWKDPTFEQWPESELPSAEARYGQSKAANIYQANAWATKSQEIVNEIGCVSVSCYPGNLKSDLQRSMAGFLSFIIKPLLFETKYGAYSELFGALYPPLTPEKNQGDYVVPFGEIQLPREDIQAGLKNGTDMKLWDWVEKYIADFK